MHKDYIRADMWSTEVIGAAIEVHRQQGPGLLEEIYEQCLLYEFELRSIPADNQVTVHLTYKGMSLAQPLRIDVLVDKCLVVELKAVEHILPIHKAQLLSYMKLTDTPLGLLINFHAPVLKSGICRMILDGANAETVDF